MEDNMLIVGGGIGGLAAALACGQQGNFGAHGKGLRLVEQAPAFTEVGAGVQLGPNATRVLHGWGLQQALARVAAFPERLEVRSAMNAKLLGVLPLGARAQAAYGAPYVTIARQDLHALLHDAVQRLGEVERCLDTRVVNVIPETNQVRVSMHDGRDWVASGVLGADGVHSTLRHHLVSDGASRITGHLAFRALVRQSDLHVAQRSQLITVWMGPHFHAVQYPVHAGEFLNLAVIVHGTLAGDVTTSDYPAHAKVLRNRLVNACGPLLELVEAIEGWQVWELRDRPPMRSHYEMASGRLALLGDAAHPMRPYLAQGAGMAIEDARQLSLSLHAHQGDVQRGFEHYAAVRWKRNAQAQVRAIRNGKIFHLKGPMRLARDLSMQLGGEKLLDMPWLYGYKEACFH
jgi:salicylate hydroxylase